LIPVDVGALKSDEKIDVLIDQARNENPEPTEIIGRVDQSSFRKYYRESTLGNLFSDMLREVSKADLALINSGSLRADLNAGAITREELINIYPFVDKYHVVEIDGSALKELLEYSYQLTYGFGQISGLTSKYNSDNPEGSKLIKAKVNGKSIDDLKKYTVACSSFLANGGDGFYMLKNGNVIYKSKENLIDAYLNYIIQAKELTIPDLGRQVDISKK